MKILQLHSEYSTSKISGENSTVNNLHKIFSSFSSAELYRVSTASLHNNLFARYSALEKYLFSDQHVLELSKDFDFILLHNPIPLVSAQTIRKMSSNSQIVRVWHNFRNSCISGSHFRNGSDCFECRDKLTGRLAGVVHRCYRDSIVQSSVVSFAESRLGKLYRDREIFHVGISEFMCNYIESLGIDRSRIQHIPNAVIGMDFTALPQGDDLLMMGRIEPEKGFVKFLEAWNSLSASLKRGRTLHIVGEGSQSNVVSKFASIGDIEVHGVLSPPEISKLASYCGTGVACSIWDEPFGKIAAEYQAMGLKTLVTPRGGLMEVAKSSPGGLVTKDTSVESISRSLVEILNQNFVSRHEIFDAYQKNYSVESIANRWKVFFGELKIE